MKSSWSFRGHIAVPLEKISNVYAKKEGLKIEFTANMIESGAFVSVMIFWLGYKYGNSTEVIDFIEQTVPFLKKGYLEFSKETAEELFEKFKLIFNEDII